MTRIRPQPPPQREAAGGSHDCKSAPTIRPSSVYWPVRLCVRAHELFDRIRPVPGLRPGCDHPGGRNNLTPGHTERTNGERGSGGASLGFILLMPAVLLLIFGGIQFGLHSYARSLAVAAAQAGVRAATQAPASADRGRQAAEDFVINKAAGTLTDPVIAVTQAGQQITVTVIAAAPNLVPLAHPHVAGRASAEIENLP